MSQNSRHPSTFSTPSANLQPITTEYVDAMLESAHQDLWYSRITSSLRSSGYVLVGRMSYARIARGFRFDVHVYPVGDTPDNASMGLRVSAVSTAPNEAKRARVEMNYRLTELRGAQIQKFESRCMRALRALLG